MKSETYSEFFLLEQLRGSYDRISGSSQNFGCSQWLLFHIPLYAFEAGHIFQLLVALATIPSICLACNRKQDSYLFGLESQQTTWLSFHLIGAGPAFWVWFLERH